MQNSWKIAALFTVAALSMASGGRAQSSFDLKSPDKRIEVRIRTAQGVRYDVVLNGRAILENCSLSIDVDHKIFGKDASKVLHSKERGHDEMIEPVVRQKFAKIRDHYNEVHLEMDGGYGVDLPRLQRRRRLPAGDFPSPARSEDLRRRNEPEFFAERHGLLSARRQLHVPQRKKISAAAFVGDPAGIHCDAARRR